jgi:ribonuclease R
MNKKKDIIYTTSELEMICLHINKKEIEASKAERESIKYKQVQFLEDKIGMEFKGIITGIKDWGIYVEIIENKCEGMINKSNLHANGYDINPEKHRIEFVDGSSIRLSDEVTIIIDEVSLVKKEINFSIKPKL